MTRRQGDNLRAAAVQERVGAGDKALRTVSDKRSKRRLDVLVGAGAVNGNLLTKRARRLASFRKLVFDIGVRAVYENGDHARLAYHFSHKLQPFHDETGGEHADARRVAAGTAEACREAVLDRVVSDQKHDRDRRGGRLRRQRRDELRREDDRNRLADNFGR